MGQSDVKLRFGGQQILPVSTKRPVKGPDSEFFPDPEHRSQIPDSHKCSSGYRRSDESECRYQQRAKHHIDDGGRKHDIPENMPILLVYMRATRENDGFHFRIAAYEAKRTDASVASMANANECQVSHLVLPLQFAAPRSW